MYFRDTAIKVMDCIYPGINWKKCKEIWYKEGKYHRDEKDPETGLTLPAYITAAGTQIWYNEGTEIDPHNL